MSDSHSRSGSASAFSTMAPLKIPTVVIPTWMVERKPEGSLLRFSAAFAPGEPLSASFCKRDFLEETTAISDIARMPLNRMSNSRRNMSINIGSFENILACFSSSLHYTCLSGSGIRCQGSGIKTGLSVLVLIPDPWHLIPDPWHLIPDPWNEGAKP